MDTTSCVYVIRSRVFPKFTIHRNDRRFVSANTDIYIYISSYAPRLAEYAIYTYDNVSGKEKREKKINIYIYYSNSICI